jgi:hypothetical protein
MRMFTIFPNADDIDDANYAIVRGLLVLQWWVFTSDLREKSCMKIRRMVRHIS